MALFHVSAIKEFFYYTRLFFIREMWQTIILFVALGLFATLHFFAQVEIHISVCKQPVRYRHVQHHVMHHVVLHLSVK